MRKGKKSPSGTNGRMIAHRIFGESFYENLAALMDEQIAEMMREPRFRKMVQEFNARMFEVMAEIARGHMAGNR